MTYLKADLLSLSDFAWQRLRSRVEGLTDEEFCWEPVPGCWSVRPVGSGGTFRMDGGPPPPEPAPFTTIGWRAAHLVDVLQTERTATWIGVRPEASDGVPVVPGTAASAREALDRAYAAWRRRVEATSDDELGAPLGPIAGPYADDTRNAFVLHILDELIHHGAEIGVVRDLYQARQLDDPFVAACLRGDTQVVERLRAADPGIVEKTVAAHPDLLRRAASARFWDAVRLLADLGFAVGLRAGAPGASALHYAAGAGELEIVQLLLAHGADDMVADPVFRQPPRGWAEYFGHAEVAAFLTRRAEG